MDKVDETLRQLFTQQGGTFLHEPQLIRKNLQNVNTILFDWDGVFTNGRKDSNRNSTFSEVDTMGINMLRFAWFIASGSVPFTGIVTGEENPGAMVIAERDRFDAVYYQVKNKSQMKQKLHDDFGVDVSRSIFFFDDILDLSLVRETAASFALRNEASFLFQQQIRTEEKCAYISANSGATHGIREICELLIGILGLYEQVVNSRSNFDEHYLSYLETRNKVMPRLITL